jgi:uncharacterized RDD family membrane protein YckC
MKWYYAEGGKQLGPIEESELDDLVRQGVVRDETLVWREGMGAWQRHAAVRGPSAGSADTGAPVPAVPVAAGAGDSRYCSECGRSVPASQLSTFGDISVCTQCLPGYSQRLREGGSTRRFGGFWIRFLARVIDSLILGIAFCVIFVPLVLLMGGFGAFFGALAERNPPADAGLATLGIMSILGIVAVAIGGPALYEIYFVSTRAATPGKLALGLRIIRADSSPITTGLAAGRYFAYFLTSLIPLAIGYIMAGFDREKRALHDHICGTRVVYIR